MKIRGHYLGLLLLVPGPALAQSATSSQIDAVYAAQQEQEDAYRAAQAAQQEQEAHDREVQEKQARAQAAVAETHRRREAAVRRESERRDGANQQQLKSINIEQQMLVLQAEKARVARENEFIDRELAQQSANTDVTKSEADVNRNLSVGIRTLLEKKGEAEVDAVEHTKPKVRVAEHVDEVDRVDHSE